MLKNILYDSCCCVICAGLAGLSKTIALTLLAILDNSLSSVEIIISSCGKALLAWIIVHSNKISLYKSQHFYGQTFTSSLTGITHVFSAIRSFKSSET